GDVPHEAAALAALLRGFIDRVPAGQPVLFVLDALNQLDETDHAHEMAWLPARLPPHVKVVASCITGPGDEGDAGPILEAFRRRPPRHVRILPLADAERRAIVRQVPSLSAKALDGHQVGLLLDNPATRNPLYLLVALEELRGFGSYEQLNERIAAFPREGDSVTALFRQVLERLEQEFDPDLVRGVLTALASAR